MTKVKKESKDYSRAYREREQAKRDAMGVVDVTLPLPASIAQMAKDVCERDGFESMTEMLLTLIRAAHAGAPVVIPPSGYVPKQKHLAKIGKPQSCSACSGDGFIKVFGTGGEQWTEECLQCEGVES